MQHIDWIQTRYLLIKCSNSAIKLDETDEKPKQVFQQDPSLTPNGEKGKIIIPASAISRSRRGKSTPPTRPATCSSFGASLKRKLGGGSAADPIHLDDDDDTASVATLAEDRDIFKEDTPPPPPPHNAVTKSSKSMTDFVAGSLDVASLPILAAPSYATPGASKRLLVDFKTLVKVQDSTPLHELGWYINPDPELMTNLYQWIVELHSFDSALPLAKDMKKHKITSVVMEMRFGKDFPHTPPFVRVIRPRFLGFSQGGGGHVTLGGAICMELLTNSGWSAVSSIESVLFQGRGRARRPRDRGGGGGVYASLQSAWLDSTAGFDGDDEGNEQ